jgi:hypothetical protein
LAGGFSQESASTNQLQIVWSVPTNHLPSSVWIYKFVPQTFSPVVVSNLMALGSFTSNDQTNIQGQPPFKDKQLTYYRNKTGTRELGIFPPFGFIYFYDHGAEAKKHELAVGVPNDAESYQLGLKYLQLLGVDRSQLATKADTSDLRVVRTVETGGWMDKEHGTNFEQTYKRGVYFIRRVNGIDFDGMVHGGANFEFGNNGKIFRLEMLWKGLEPYELRPTLTSDQLIAGLRAGKGKWLPFAPDSNVQKITITEVQPLYRGFAGDDEDGNKFLEPYIRLQTLIDTGSTNIVADFDCSIY